MPSFTATTASPAHRSAWRSMTTEFEIINPGGLAKGLSLRDFGTVSIRRNELIADLFFRLHKVERIGMGIQKMKAAMVAVGLPEPAFGIDAFFRASFQRSPEFA